jgi:hypothetical protein
MQWGAASCLNWIVHDTAMSTPVLCSHWHDASHLCLGGPLPLLAVYRDIAPLCNMDARGWPLGGVASILSVYLGGPRFNPNFTTNEKEKNRICRCSDNELLKMGVDPSSEKLYGAYVKNILDSGQLLP